MTDPSNYVIEAALAGILLWQFQRITKMGETIARLSALKERTDQDVKDIKSKISKIYECMTKIQLDIAAKKI